MKLIKYIHLYYSLNIPYTFYIFTSVYYFIYFFITIKIKYHNDFFQKYNNSKIKTNASIHVSNF